MIGSKFTLHKINTKKYKQNFSLASMTPPPTPPSRMIQAVIIITCIIVFNNRKKYTR